MKIAGITFKYGVFLAPMAGIGDHAFRSVCIEMGAEGVCSELLSAKALVFQNAKTELLAKITDDERPAAIQIFGNDPVIMSCAAEKLLKYKPDYIDINMGCPVPKLMKNREGCELMRDPVLCGRIVAEVKKAVKIPVTVKIRRGIDEGSENAAEVAAICEQNGADAIFVHGRTAKQLYSGKAELEIIKKVKNAVSVPVIGNGDITDAASAKNMLAATGCDGIMIGRGAFGSPWIFREIIAFFNGEQYIPPDDAEKKEIILRHIRRSAAEKGERGITEARKHLSKYTKNRKGSAALRSRINLITELNEAEKILEELFGKTT